MPYALALRANRSRRAIGRLFGDGRARPQSVLYAIDNFDARRGFQQRGRGGDWARGLLFDAMFRFLLSGVDRIAFGTEGARCAYEKAAGKSMRAIDTTVIEELDQECGCGRITKDENLLLFLGALDDRKGVLELMASWPEIHRRSPSVRLVIVGKGDYEERVGAWAERAPSVTFVVDPPRADIHAWYRRARTVVLLSQPHPRWREQVGLPITEGLSHGCRIIATTETGLADWLVRNGHCVVPPDCSAEVLAAEVALSFAGVSDASAVLSTLPTESTRITVDRWLTRSGRRSFNGSSQSTV